MVQAYVLIQTEVGVSTRVCTDIAELTGVVEALVTGGYYAVVRVAEQYAPALGVLLGASKQPRY